MAIELGPRDDKRFKKLDDETRELLTFQLDFTMGILNTRPSQPEALALAANALTGMGYYADGLALDRRLSAIAPEDPTVVYNLACSLALTHHNEEALDRLEEAIRLGFENPALMARDDDLAPLRGHPRFVQILARARGKAV